MAARLIEEAIYQQNGKTYVRMLAGALIAILPCQGRVSHAFHYGMMIGQGARFLRNPVLNHILSHDILQIHQGVQTGVQVNAFLWVEDIDQWLSHHIHYPEDPSLFV